MSAEAAVRRAPLSLFHRPLQRKHDTLYVPHAERSGGGLLKDESGARPPGWKRDRRGVYLGEPSPCSPAFFPQLLFFFR